MRRVKPGWGLGANNHRGPQKSDFEIRAASKVARGGRGAPAAGQPPLAGVGEMDRCAGVHRGAWGPGVGIVVALGSLVSHMLIKSKKNGGRGGGDCNHKITRHHNMRDLSLCPWCCRAARLLQYPMGAPKTEGGHTAEEDGERLPVVDDLPAAEEVPCRRPRPGGKSNAHRCGAGSPEIGQQQRHVCPRRTHTPHPPPGGENLI